jgi:predicted nuclease of restriction endonuclease-like (RecB) superfamily
VFLLGLKDQERRFYEIEAAEQAWTLRDLKRQFNAGLYERLALGQLREWYLSQGRPTGYAR